MGVYHHHPDDARHQARPGSAVRSPRRSQRKRVGRNRNQSRTAGLRIGETVPFSFAHSGQGTPVLDDRQWDVELKKRCPLYRRRGDSKRKCRQRQCGLSTSKQAIEQHVHRNARAGEIEKMDPDPRAPHRLVRGDRVRGGRGVATHSKRSQNNSFGKQAPGYHEQIQRASDPRLTQMCDRTDPLMCTGLVQEAPPRRSVEGVRPKRPPEPASLSGHSAGGHRGGRRNSISLPRIAGTLYVIRNDVARRNNNRHQSKPYQAIDDRGPCSRIHLTCGPERQRNRDQPYRLPDQFEGSTGNICSG